MQIAIVDNQLSRNFPTFQHRAERFGGNPKVVGSSPEGRPFLYIEEEGHRVSAELKNPTFSFSPPIQCLERDGQKIHKIIKDI
ncbi:hypothetical protein SADUNF_Sadunf19G0058400 [Salix dunnii]|uniref:Uncharacterized protein n=1 Tax=Salix dunnii TaxID=1413687 RepID=A0A835J5Q6_9ROSI|nr:hypothetical protein SADUNF_Sadunf19G0058400 [Salix dunnii]